MKHAVELRLSQIFFRAFIIIGLIAPSFLPFNFAGLDTLDAVNVAQAQALSSGPSPFYEYEVIAKTGMAIFGDTLTSFGTKVSINDNGDVAFIGVLSDGSQGVFIGDNPLSIRNITPGFKDPTRNFGLGIQINNQSQVLVRDTVTTASCDRWHIRTWDGTSSDSWTEIAEGGNIGNPGCSTDYDSISSWASINNNNQVAFTAINGSLHLVATPGFFSFNEAIYGSQQQLHPMMSDDGQIILRPSVDPNSQILILNYGLDDSQGIASTTNGFTSLGSEPGITDSGKAIAFVGADGVFFHMLGTNDLVQVAGPGIASDLGYDDNGNDIEFQNYEVDSRTAVIHISSGPDDSLDGDSFVVSFMGTPANNVPTRPGSSAAWLFSNQKGIWTVRLDAEKELGGNSVSAHPYGAVPVIQIGDALDGQEIIDLAVYDQLANVATDGTGQAYTQRKGDHQIAFWAKTATGEMIVRAKQLDSDQDGLFNHWETKGIDIDGDGSLELDLSAMGANPDQRDLFLEIDWLSDRNDGINQPHSNAPAPGTIGALIQMFASAPALPNGISAGITLHVDAGSGIDALGNPYSRHMNGATLQGGDKIGQPGEPNTHVDVVYFGVPGSVSEPGVQTRSFHDIKENYFGTTDKGARELAFHYSVMADFHSFMPCNDQRFTAGVAVATINTLTSASPLPTAYCGSPNPKPSLLKGHIVKITSGTGVGQVRAISAVASDQLTLRENWAIVPDASSRFVLINGSSGLAEVYFAPSPDSNSIPGNDHLVTIGGFGVNQGGWLGNECVQWRTHAHELGHTLGLRHGGTDHSPYKANQYLSLMSYSWQMDCSKMNNPSYISPVQSYSYASDPSYDDWANLKVSASQALIHLGNSFALAMGSTIEPETDEFTVADYEELNQAPVDLSSPIVSITKPAGGDGVQPGGTLVVNMAVTDNVQVNSVQVSFDIDGDGDVDGSGETIQATATGAEIYEAWFGGISGPTNQRGVSVVAEDTVGNPALSIVYVEIGGNQFPTADSQIVETDADTPVAITLTASDPEGTALTYAIVMQPTNGTLSGTAPDLTYTPNIGFNGTDSFTFVANDGTADSNIATLTIAVKIKDQPAVLQVAPQQLAYLVKTDGTYSGPQSFTITNGGGGQLNWKIAGSPWGMTLSAVEGTAPTTVVGSLIMERLDLNFTGFSSSAIAIEAGEATACIDVIYTTQKVGAVPLITLAPSALTFRANGGNPPSQTITLKPIPEFSEEFPGVYWTAFSVTPWLSTRGMSGQIKSGACSAITNSVGALLPELPLGELKVTVDATGLAEGTYVAKIVFMAVTSQNVSDFPFFIPVTLIVGGGPTNGGDSKVFIPVISAN